MSGRDAKNPGRISTEHEDTACPPSSSTSKASSVGSQASSRASDDVLPTSPPSTVSSRPMGYKPVIVRNVSDKSSGPRHEIAEPHSSSARSATYWQDSDVKHRPHPTKKQDTLSKVYDPYDPLIKTISRVIEAGEIPRSTLQLYKAAIFLAQDPEHAWIEELADSGFSLVEIRSLLVEEQTQSPWIYYDPPVLDGSDLDICFHVPGCLHMERFGERHDKFDASTTETPKRHTINQAVAEMCGLAGLVPSTAGPPTWNGKARFRPDLVVDGASFATITYGYAGLEAGQLETLELGIELRDLVQCSLDALNRIVSLAAWLQKYGLICNKFTILTQQTIDVVQTVNIPFQLLRQLQRSLQLVLHGTHETNPYVLCNDCAQSSLAILRLIFPNAVHDDSSPNWEYAIDCCAITVQSVCIGLLGYSDAHIGRLHPFFLEHDLTEVQLHGANGSFARAHGFCVRLARLSCLGDLLEAPVRVFTAGHAFVNAKSDLLASLDDLLDMWGPGEIIADRHANTTGDICLVRLGDGVLYRTTDKSRVALHWARGSTLMEAHDQHHFDRRQKLLIGVLPPLATLNSNCPISHASTSHQTLSRFQTNSMLHELGTWAAHWDEMERQAGLQGGNFVLGTFNITWAKTNSETIKKEKLRGGQLDLQFLEAPWGMQVSACTGVAQRVPLRVVVADAMVPMVDAWGYRPDEWTVLLGTHNIVDHFRSEDFQSWFNGLDGQHRHAVLSIAEYILKKLAYTGFRDQGQLVLACPVPQDAFACIHISCKREQLWTKILKDSEECATFACMTSKCLETSDHKCRKSQSVEWNKPVLLVTAVCQYHRAQSGTWEKEIQQGLQNGNTYWMGEPGDEMEFKARLHGPSSPGCAKVLEVCASLLPAKIRQRVIATRLLTSGRSIRLQERRKVNEDYAEPVFVSGDTLRLKKKPGNAQTNLTP